MSEHLYYKDQYLKETEAEVVEIREGKVVLSATIFYPECGGQPGDRGTFGPYTILDTQKGEDGEALHVVEGVLPQVGERHILRLDWEHRYHYMKEHTAQHLLSATLFHEKGIGTVAVHQGEEILTIETDQGDIPEEDLLYIEDVANRHINENRKVWQKEMSHKEAEALGMRRSIKVDGDVLVVFIDNLDAVACGGVHIASTGEIGEVVYRGKEMIRGHVRTLWSCSEGAVAYRRNNEKAVKEAGKLLSTDASGLKAEVERLLGENNDLKRQVKALKKRVAETEFEALSEGKDRAVLLVDSAVEDLVEVACVPGKEFFLLEKNGKGFLYWGNKETFSLFRSSGMVKGGGRDTLFRGTYLVEQDAMKAKAEEILAL